MSDIFGGPVLGPEDKLFPRLTGKEQDVLEAKCLSQIRKNAEALLPKDCTPQYRFEQLSAKVPAFITYNTLSNYLFARLGAVESIALSLVLGGTSDAEAREYICNKLPIDMAIDIGRRVALGDGERFLIPARKPDAVEPTSPA